MDGVCFVFALPSAMLPQSACLTIAVLASIAALVGLHQHERVAELVSWSEPASLAQWQSPGPLPSAETSRSIDIAFCGTSPCRVLVCEATRERT